MRRYMPAAALVAAALAVTGSQAQEPKTPGAQKTATPAVEFKDLDSFAKSLPAATVRPLDPQGALLFAALPLACLDELQPKPTARPYFWEATYKTVDNHDKTRAFYGCGDWHTAVKATWTVVTMLKRYPDLPVGGLIREKLADHLGRQNLEGELSFFKDAGNFERPYGYAWLLKLHAELASWKDPEGTRWADNVAPLARYFADSLITYLVDLDRPNRAATQQNTAFSLGMLLDYVDATRDATISRAAGDTAKRLFAGDTNCATDTEAASPEMISPCLAEAAVMSRVLDQAAFVAWFDKFLPPVFSPKFKPLTTVSLDAVGTGRRGGGRGRGDAEAPAAAPAAPVSAERAAGTEPPKTIEAQAAAAPGAAGGGGGGRGGPPASPKATWAGLAFTRADAYTRLAAALPPDDKRVPVFRQLALVHAQKGQQGLADPAALDAPWLGTYAIWYLTTSADPRRDVL
jgi:hypothetical protein